VSYDSRTANNLSHFDCPFHGGLKNAHTNAEIRNVTADIILLHYKCQLAEQESVKKEQFQLNGSGLEWSAMSNPLSQHLIHLMGSLSGPSIDAD
jgi:hypothetical protein